MKPDGCQAKATELRNVVTNHFLMVKAKLRNKPIVKGERSIVVHAENRDFTSIVTPPHHTIRIHFGTPVCTTIQCANQADSRKEKC